jgi:hypothetical protein
MFKIPCVCSCNFDIDRKSIKVLRIYKQLIGKKKVQCTAIYEKVSTGKWIRESTMLSVVAQMPHLPQCSRRMCTEDGS